MRQTTRCERPRLTGATTLVWRSSTDLQIGLDDDAIVLSAVPRSAEEVLRRLDGRHHVGELGRILPMPWVEWILASLEAQGRLADGPAPRRRVSARVIGTGSLGSAVAKELVEAGVRVRLAESHPQHYARSRLVAEHLGQQLRPRDRPVVEPDLDLRSAAVTVTILALDTAEPERTLTDLLVAARVPHLVVRVQPARAVVGPFVLPGQTACVRCSDLARTAVDRSWPMVACQLARLHVSTTGALARWAVSLAVAHTMAYAAGAEPESLTGTLELGNDAVTRFRRWARHPSCGCRGADLSEHAARMGA